jgi:uncharacterized membrane protein YfhO
MNFIKKQKYILSTFGISFLIMMIGFAALGLFPFGKSQIMVIDSWHQYYPFLQELHEKLQHGDSLFYSWNMGMGSNFILVMAYYAFSPIYLLSVVFPREYLREFMMLATAIKIALAGSFFAIYLRGTYKKEDYSIVGFGMFYAFCGFAMGYYWNIMWLDAMALLPLIMLGLNKVIDGEGFSLYIITLSIALISNFYIGFFICEFILIYFFILYFTKISGFNLNHFVKKTLLIGLYSAIAVGLAAIVLLPTFKGLQLSYAVNATFPTEFKTYFSILEILNNMLAGVSPSVKSGLPNIFSSFLALYMLGVFFISTEVRIKEKVMSFILITFFLLSFNINYLNFIWHAFHFPNEVPYRFAFIFSFLILSWAYRGFENLETLPKRQFWFISIAILGYLLINEKMELSDVVFYVSLGVLALYTILIQMYRYEVIRKKAFVVGLCVMILAESILSAILGTATTGASARDSYPYLGDEIREAVESIYAADDEAYRLEMVKWYSTNDPTLYTYRGVSMFSSTVNSKISIFTQKLGLAASPESNRYLFAASTPLVNGLLGVKYFMGREPAGTKENAGYSLMSSTDKVSIYKNNYPLPLGFVVDDLIYNWNNTHRSPFVVQEDFVKAAIGQDIKLYTNVPITSDTYVNMERSSIDNIRYGYKNLDSSKVGNATVIINAPEKKQMYLYMFANRSYKTNVTVLNKTTEYETRRGLIIDLGILEQGTEIKLEFETHAAKDGYFNLQAVMFDETAYADVHRALADEPLQITEFKSSKVVGTVDANHDGVMYTSIPYEKGWTVKVDGVKVEVDPIQNAVIAFPISTGRHEVIMTYVPDGLINGLLITLVSLVGFIALFLRYERKPRDKKTMRGKNTKTDKNSEITEPIKVETHTAEAQTD